MKVKLGQERLMFFRKIPVVGELLSDELAYSVVDQSTHETIVKDQLLVKQGEDSSFIYFILSGFFEAYCQSEVKESSYKKVKTNKKNMKFWVNNNKQKRRQDSPSKIDESKLAVRTDESKLNKYSFPLSRSISPMMNKVDYKNINRKDERIHIKTLGKGLIVGLEDAVA